MTTTAEHDVNALVAHARGDYAAFIAAAEVAVQPRRNVRKSNSLAREAGSKAAEAANDIPELAEELLFQWHEAETAHEHMVRAVVVARRYKAAADVTWRAQRTADEATARAERAEAEAVCLRAELDQARAALRDREVAP